MGPTAVPARTGFHPGLRGQGTWPVVWIVAGPVQVLDRVKHKMFRFWKDMLQQRALSDLSGALPPARS